MTNNFLRYLVALYVLVSIASCLKVEAPPATGNEPEFIVFGTYTDPGNCFGSIDQCVNIYKMDASGLFEDADSNTPNGLQPMNGNYSETRTVNAYQNVSQLFKNNPLPSELLNAPSGKVGTAPTWANNFYVEYKTSTTYKYWILDGSFDGSLPSAIQNYLSTIQQAVNLAAQG
jgi:hypothetical protein